MVRRLIPVMAALALTGSVAATAAPKRVTLHNMKTFSLRAGKTMTFGLAYPDALKYSGSKYSAQVQVLPPAAHTQGGRPSLQKVTVLNKGSCVGGSSFCATVRNANRSGTAAAQVKLTTTTLLPAGKKK